MQKAMEILQHVFSLKDFEKSGDIMTNITFRKLSMLVCDICYCKATKKVVVSHCEIVADKMSHHIQERIKKKRQRAELEIIRQNLQKKFSKEMNPNLSESEELDLE